MISSALAASPLSTRVSLDALKKPHTCTITDISGWEMKRAEERLRAFGVLGPDDEIGGAVKAVSFDETLGDLRTVLEEGLNEDRTSSFSSERMYEVITDFKERVESDRTARVETRYKTVDPKVRPVAAPLPKGNEERMKGVASDPGLRSPSGIGHRFTDITLQ